ncbi:Transcription regulatory protein SNF2 [Pichia kudriavzevii]|uniref:Transcription regulatory protein SNF2 n=1 Tax=Pichia kudriavzevii TaxID=4909 RepID=A0A1V2LSA5_PICKU|nr:Transcription regulatory protein SNF2 [Pichia kudriavzevii]
MPQVESQRSPPASSPAQQVLLNNQFSNHQQDIQNLYRQANIQKQVQAQQLQKIQPPKKENEKEQKKAQRKQKKVANLDTTAGFATPSALQLNQPIDETPVKKNYILPPRPPQSLGNLEKLYPNAKIENVYNPLARVDSFIIPNVTSEFSFEFFNTPKSKIYTPSVYPNALDLETANELKKLHENLLIQLELENLEEIARHESTYKYDFEAFKLLPYQRALRGYVLSGIFHQNMLLINHLPNFSAKVRSINLEDASLTNALYLEQKKLKNEKERSDLINKQQSLLNASDSYKKILMDKKSKYQKLAKNLTAFHQQTEKEEQRRIERNAKQRLQALKANDEEAYVKLLDQTKDTRITHLLKQTNSFLSSLTDAVRDQQKETVEKMVKVGHTEDGIVEQPDEGIDSDESDYENEEERERRLVEKKQDLDYYKVAHKIQEKIEKQPSILVGGTLKEYQLRGLEWMVSLFNNHLNGILADEMGLGKTIQSIALLTYITEAKKLPGPFLVIVPLSTLPNWNNEFDHWAPSLKKISYKGSPAYRKELAQQVKSGDFNVLLTTYEYIIKDKYLLSKIKWVHMIIDEGHRMKNTKSKLSYTLNEFYHTDYRLILTGTPLQNNLPELWALLNFVLPKIFNSVKSFDEWFNTPFANTGGQDKIELSEEETLLVIRRLHKVLRPFLLRRLKKDVEKSLPNKVERVIKCKKSGLQAKLYSQMLKYNKLFVGDKENKAVGIKGMNNKLMQLRKICNHPFVFPAIEDMINASHQNNDLIWRTSGKFELLDRILPKFKATNHRVLMFFQMTQIMDIMEDFLRFRDIKYMRLDGDTRADDRTELLKDFNAENSPYDVFLLSTRAGGLGLNLQTADTVIIFDTDWNPHQDLQAQDRAHRIGQKNEVRILRLITTDSIEEYILEKAHQKLDIDGKVIQAGKFDQKSTAEEQEALLRKLIENEDQQNEKDEDLNDEDLNELLARNEDEIKKFREVDAERERQWNSELPRLYSEEELPEIYNQEPEPEEEPKENLLMNYGRGTRERKVTQYDENMTEEQWLREIDGLVSEDEEKFPKKRPRKSLKKKKEESREGTSDSINEDATEDTHDDKRMKSSSKKIGIKTTSPSRTPEVSDGISAPLVRRRKNFGSLPLSREIYPSEDPTPKDRAELQMRMSAILDHIQNYANPVGRKLCKIFNSKPQRRLYPDYYVIIKNPIAFDTVKRRVNNWTYNTLEEYMFDIHLIFKNARLYNLETSVVYSDSMILESQALKKYVEYIHKPLDFSEFDLRYGLHKPNGDPISDPTVRWDEEKQEAYIIEEEEEEEEDEQEGKKKEDNERHTNAEADEAKRQKNDESGEGSVLQVE